MRRERGARTSRSASRWSFCRPTRLSGWRRISAPPGPGRSSSRRRTCYFHPPPVARESRRRRGELVTLAPGTSVTGFLHEGVADPGRPDGGRYDREPGSGRRGRSLVAAARRRGRRPRPLVPTRHQLFITEPIPGIEPHHPIISAFTSRACTRGRSRAAPCSGATRITRFRWICGRNPRDSRCAICRLTWTCLGPAGERLRCALPALLGRPAARASRRTLDHLARRRAHRGPGGDAERFLHRLGSATSAGCPSPPRWARPRGSDRRRRLQPDLGRMSVERLRGRDLDEDSLREACARAYARKHEGLGAGGSTARRTASSVASTGAGRPNQLADRASVPRPWLVRMQTTRLPGASARPSPAAALPARAAVEAAFTVDPFPAGEIEQRPPDRLVGDGHRAVPPLFRTLS